MWCFVILFIDVLPSLPFHSTLSSFSRCFAITHLFEVDVSPSHMFVTLLWFSISLIGLIFCYLFYWRVAIFAMISCYPLADVSPLHILFEAEVSPSHMIVILLWFSISFLDVMFCHLCYWCFAIFAMIPYNLLADVSPSHICLKPMFRHRICLLSYFDSQYHF